MNHRLIVILILLFASVTFVSAQETRTPIPESDIPVPLVILKSSTVVIEIDPAKGDTLNHHAIKSEAIESVDMVSGEDAIETYGEKGSRGVIVITLKDNYVVNKDSLVKIRKLEE